MSTYFEKQFIKYNLVDIQQIDSSIAVDLKYASTDNFMSENMYGEIEKAYLVPEVATRVVQAKKFLTTMKPGYNMLIFDAARPISIQRKMFDKVRGTEQEIYVANPDNNGGFHNYGMAVDLTIIDNNGCELDMGSPFDYFGEISHIGNEETLLSEHKISKQAYDNRMLLYQIMNKFDLYTHPNEWWHYQYHQTEEDKTHFPLLDF